MKKNLLLFIMITGVPAITSAQSPANDQCPAASSLSLGCGSSTSASTVGATASFPPACTATDADDDIWYSFTASSSSMSVSISNAVLQTSGIADIGMEVIAGGCFDYTSIFCDNNIASGSGVQTVSGLSAGSKYWIRFWTTGTTSEATFDFCMQDLTVVPVKLSAYSAFCINGFTTINWTTTETVNSNAFSIEKSMDGKQFETIGSVKTTPETTHRYTFTDTNQNNGKEFYRLKQIDNNGKTQYFDILTADCSNNNVNVYPNPAKDILTIQLNNHFTPGLIKIFDLRGAVIKMLDYKKIQQGTIIINTGNLTNGTYLLYASDKSGNIFTKKFIKN